ncbi:MAG TPA: hypothetical protein VK675_02250 [Candidatus Paceibacterota bacterium]|nr:hypothetical protein [Candidatus Paceibacterota bacterium]
MQKISGTLPSGSKFSFEISPIVYLRMSATPNQSPKGITVEEEIKVHMKKYLGLLEITFAAPEPMRRTFLTILENYAERIGEDVHDSAEVVGKIISRRVRRRN